MFWPSGSEMSMSRTSAPSAPIKGLSSMSSLVVLLLRCSLSQCRSAPRRDQCVNRDAAMSFRQHDDRIEIDFREIVAGLDSEVGQRFDGGDETGNIGSGTPADRFQ